MMMTEGRAYYNYADGGNFKGDGVPLDWLHPGYYKIRSYSGGPWIPIEVWLEDGERDPETWELLSDQVLRAQWWPRTDSKKHFAVNPRRFFNKARPIDRSEFEWMMISKTIGR